MYHLPVLFQPALEALAIQPEGVYVDATFGGGGHAAGMLQHLNEKGRLYAFDQDADAERNAQAPPFAQQPQFRFIRSNFRYLREQLRAEGVRKGSVTGILADLGVSSHQLDTAARGFSYRFEAPLDMRMNKEDSQTAADLLNTLSVEQIQHILSAYGELRNARTLAQAIVRRRDSLPFRSTGDLLELCQQHVIGDRMRYLSQVFQALRMAVNDELGALEQFLYAALDVLAPGGRLCVITFHSLEDRMVKHFMKTGNVEGLPDKDFYGNQTRLFEVLTKKPIEADATEQEQNPRSRSAKLRVAVKIA